MKLIVKIFAFLILVVILPGCRTDKEKISEQAHQEISIEVGGNATTAIVSKSIDTTQNHNATAQEAHETGEIDIHRDSTGNLVRITWSKSGKLSAQTTDRGERKKWFYGLNATRHSESGTEISAEEKETSKETTSKRRHPILVTLAVGVLVLVVVGSYKRLIR